MENDNNGMLVAQDQVVQPGNSLNKYSLYAYRAGCMYPCKINVSSSIIFCIMLVVEEEVRDLKLCLTSADKELLEVKNEMSNSKTQWENLQAELYKKVRCTLWAVSYCNVHGHA